MPASNCPVYGVRSWPKPEDLRFVVTQNQRYLKHIIKRKYASRMTSKPALRERVDRGRWVCLETFRSPNGFGRASQSNTHVHNGCCRPVTPGWWIEQRRVQQPPPNTRCIKTQLKQVQTSYSTGAAFYSSGHAPKYTHMSVQTSRRPAGSRKALFGCTHVNRSVTIGDDVTTSDQGVPAAAHVLPSPTAEKWR